MCDEEFREPPDPDYWGDPEDEPDEPWRDTKIDEAKKLLLQYFKDHEADVFYGQQLQVIFEQQFFHWITQRALLELWEEDRITAESDELTKSVPIRFYTQRRNRYWKRKAEDIKDLVRTFSESTFTKALGVHAEQMFDAALPRGGFMPTARHVNAYGGRQWTVTGENLDRIFERDGIAYGVEIKNTLKYMPRKEMASKLAMCDLPGLRPLFIVRMAPKNYIQEVRQKGGYTLVFKYQLYPHGFQKMVGHVQKDLSLPVDSPSCIADCTIERFLAWHLAHLATPRE